MKPNFDVGPDLLQNTAAFRDPFFQRFRLRRAPCPLKLTEAITKDYLFPTLYADVRCAQAIFLCDYEGARSILPSERLRPVRMTLGRSLVAFSCYEYRNVLGVPPYNEVAMTVPVLLDGAIDAPVLPMIVPGYPGFGYHVFGMPVTSRENQIRGNEIWGLPKVTEEVVLREEAGDCVTEVIDASGETYFSVRVPMSGKPTRFDVRTELFSVLNGRLLRSRTMFRATFNVTKHMGLLARRGARADREYLRIGSGPSAELLRRLQIEPAPLQLRYAASMNSAFDLPDPSFDAN